jgi:hypothetical protein
MSQTAFLEIVLKSEDFTFDGRDAVEDPLDEALQAARLGEVTGGGSGSGSSNIDVELRDLERGLPIVRRVLQELGVARSTVIIERTPGQVVHNVYD